MENKLTLAMGANGKFARLVIPELVKRGAWVRGFVHHQKDIEGVQAQGVEEVVIGDLYDSATIDKALKDVHSVFYIAPAFQSDEAELGLKLVEAAKKANVRRIVFSSVIHPVITRLVNHSAKALVEEAILMSGMEYTFLHPAIFFQNFAGAWESVEKTDTIAEPYSKSQSMSYVDYRDVAECAAIALTEENLVNGTFELCGEAKLNREQIAQIMTECLKRPIQAQEADFDEWFKAVHISSDQNQEAGLRKMYAYYNQHSLLGNELTLKAILGRSPRKMKVYIQELSNSYHHVKERSLHAV